MRSRIATFAVLLALAAASPQARAAEDDPLTRDAKAAIEYFDKYAGKAKDDQKYSDLLMDNLARVRHELTAERIGKILLRDADEAHKMMAAGALAEFRKPDAVRDAAGKILVKGIQDDLSNDVKDSCIDSIGKIRYRDAVPVLNEVLLGGGDPYVLLTTVRVMGVLKDRRALPALLELWERHPVGYSWETGEVNVDTGAEGTADQDAAEAEWNAKYGGSQGPKKKPPVMFKVYIQELVRTVEKLTGEQLKKANELRDWMEAHREELKKEGVEIPKYKGPSKKAKENEEKQKQKEKERKDKEKEKEQKGS